MGRKTLALHIHLRTPEDTEEVARQVVASIREYERRNGGSPFRA